VYVEEEEQDDKRNAIKGQIDVETPSEKLVRDGRRV
jgi:hypothetical protein